MHASHFCGSEGMMSLAAWSHAPSRRKVFGQEGRCLVLEGGLGAPGGKYGTIPLWTDKHIWDHIWFNVSPWYESKDLPTWPYSGISIVYGHSSNFTSTAL